MSRNIIHQGMLQRTLRFMCLMLLLTASALSSAATYVSVNIAPPLLPVYAQPLIPAPGYIWNPGYWAYGPEGYYWVPGTWVLPPSVGLLWTPGYWGWSSGAYLWNAGYWGPRVGFYGGVNYGFGYFGTGYQGGYWRGGSFYYNRAVNNVNVTSVHTTYNTTVNTTTVNRVAYSGGSGGIQRQPTAVERQAMNERHVEATSMQLQHQNAAAQNRALFASENHGHPAIAATPQPGAFNQPGVVPARESQVTTNRPATTTGTTGAPTTNRAATVASPSTNRTATVASPPTNRTATVAAPSGTGSTAGAESKPGRNKSTVEGSQSLSSQGRPQGSGGRNATNAQVGTQGANPQRDKVPRQASAAMNPQQTNANGMHPPGPQAHPQGVPQGQPQGQPQGRGQGQTQGHPPKPKENGQPHGEGPPR